MMTLRECDRLYDAFDQSYLQLASVNFDLYKLPKNILDRLFGAYALDKGRNNVVISELEEKLSEWLTDNSLKRKRAIAFKLGGLGGLIACVNADYLKNLCGIKKTLSLHESMVKHGHTTPMSERCRKIFGGK